MSDYFIRIVVSTAQWVFMDAVRITVVAALRRNSVVETRPTQGAAFKVIGWRQAMVNTAFAQLSVCRVGLGPN